MVHVNYVLIEDLLKEKHTSRRKMAIDLGISTDKLNASFIRRSRMKVEDLSKIADYLSVTEFDLLERDQWGNVLPEDQEEISNGKTELQIFKEKSTIQMINIFLRHLNETGLNLALKHVKLLCEIDRLVKTDEELEAEKRLDSD